MSKGLTLADIDPEIAPKVYQQDYSPKIVIEGVKIIRLKRHIGEDGDFCELGKINGNHELEGFPGFKLVQINRTRLEPDTIKAWHIHFKQDEIWYLLPEDRIFIGLWDLRNDSKTKDITMRIVLGGGFSQLLFIPRGVAHGTANFGEKHVDLFYFMNQTFNIKNPDEKRISWDSLGENFWVPKRD